MCELSCKIKGNRVVVCLFVCLFVNCWQNMSFCCSGQGLIHDFLQWRGDTIFLKKFWIFSDGRTDEFSYNNFSNSIFIGYRPV